MSERKTPSAPLREGDAAPRSELRPSLSRTRLRLSLNRVRESQFSAAEDVANSVRQRLVDEGATHLRVVRDRRSNSVWTPDWEVGWINFLGNHGITSRATQRERALLDKIFTELQDELSKM